LIGDARLGYREGRRSDTIIELAFHSWCLPFPGLSWATADIMCASGALCVSASTEVPTMTIPGIPIHRPSPALSANGLAALQPVTVDERRADIDRISLRITDIVRFMCDMKDLPGTSTEVRDKALTAFHERMVAAEKQLAHIQDRLRLE
jgi:hypothetical protein